MASVLIVDDSKLVRLTIKSILAKAGDIEVVGEAENGREGVDMARELEPDVVTLDIEMPQMNGITLCQELRQRHEYKYSPIIMLTAMSEKKYVDQAFVAGATDYVTKPFDLLELRSRLGTARKLIDDLDARDVLKILWDPANNCWCHEEAWPRGYETAKDGYLGHIHIKDVQVDTPSATLEVRRLGEGQLADQFQPVADALRADSYDGVISLESVYHPGGGDFEAGFRLCVDRFKELFE